MNIPTIKPEWLAGITMTSEQKAKWLAALRSGEYSQCKDKLQAGGSYCCLGVAAELGIARAQGMFVLDEDFLGPASRDGIQETLSNMNDNGASFAEIADFIEREIPACDEVTP